MRPTVCTHKDAHLQLPPSFSAAPSSPPTTTPTAVHCASPAGVVCPFQSREDRAALCRQLPLGVRGGPRCLVEFYFFLRLFFCCRRRFHVQHLGGTAVVVVVVLVVSSSSGSRNRRSRQFFYAAGRPRPRAYWRRARLRGLPVDRECEVWGPIGLRCVHASM